MYYDKPFPVPDAVFIKIKIQLGILWTDVLGDRSSDEFKALEDAITKDVENLYEKVSGEFSRLPLTV